MNLHDLQALFLDGKLADSEVGEIIEDGFHDAGTVTAVDVQLDVRELLLEVAEHVREDVETGGFVGRDEPVRPGGPAPIR